MNALQQLGDFLKAFTKYVIPLFFGILAFVLIIESTKVEEFENVICHKGEFNPDEADLLTIDDLKEGDLPKYVSEYKSGIALEQELGAQVSALKDSINSTNNLLWDPENPPKQEDSLYYDSLKVAMGDELKQIIPKYNDTKISTKKIYNTHILPAMTSENFLKIRNAELKDVQIRQNQLFLVGGVGLLIMSILMALFIGNVISRQVTFIVLPIVAVGSIFYLYTIYDSIMDMEKHDKKKEKVYSETIQRMEDIKTGILLFKEQHNGRVPENLDELIEFIKTGKAISVTQTGDTPKRPLTKVESYILWSGMFNGAADSSDTETFYAKVDAWADTTYVTYGDSAFNRDYAYQLGHISIDSTVLSVEEKLYTGPLAKKRPYTKLDFSADSLKFQAFTQEKLIYRHDAVPTNPGDSVLNYKYRFEVRLARPMLIFSSDHECEARKELILGSLQEDKFSGNW